PPRSAHDPTASQPGAACGALTLETSRPRRLLVLMLCRRSRARPMSVCKPYACEVALPALQHDRHVRCGHPAVAIGNLRAVDAHCALLDESHRLAVGAREPGRDEEAGKPRSPVLHANPLITPCERDLRHLLRCRVLAEQAVEVRLGGVGSGLVVIERNDPTSQSPLRAVRVRGCMLERPFQFHAVPGAGKADPLL